jgi:hypothetical protein
MFAQAMTTRQILARLYRRHGRERPRPGGRTARVEGAKARDQAAGHGGK